MKTKQITAAFADKLMERREQSQACLGYAESRQKKTEGQKIKQLYETAFPEDEQIPWEDYDDDNNASNITHKSYF